MTKQAKSIRPVRHFRKGSHPAKGIFLHAVVLSFLSGVALCTLMLLLFAFLLASTALPLTLVRPFACTAAAIGAAASGFLLAKKLNRQYLLCGLGCGIFYGICQTIASFVASGSLVRQGSDLMLPVALVLGGVLGATCAALRTVH